MAPASPDGLHVIILGGGVAGLTTALALTKFAPAGKVPKIEIFELRPEPATIGGAVNLTPNALRLLDHLGALPIIRQNNYGMTINAVEIFDIYSGKLAESSFRGPNGDGIGNPPYKVYTPLPPFLSILFHTQTACPPTNTPPSSTRPSA